MAPTKVLVVYLFLKRIIIGAHTGPKLRGKLET